MILTVSLNLQNILTVPGIGYVFHKEEVTTQPLLTDRQIRRLNLPDSS